MTRIDRVIEQVHRLRHGHDPVWDNGFDGIGLDWFCRLCHPERPMSDDDLCPFEARRMARDCMDRLACTVPAALVTEPLEDHHV